MTMALWAITSIIDTETCMNYNNKVSCDDPKNFVIRIFNYKFWRCGNGKRQEIY